MDWRTSSQPHTHTNTRASTHNSFKMWPERVHHAPTTACSNSSGSSRTCLHTSYIENRINYFIKLQIEWCAHTHTNTAVRRLGQRECSRHRAERAHRPYVCLCHGWESFGLTQGVHELESFWVAVMMIHRRHSDMSCRERYDTHTHTLA